MAEQCRKGVARGYRCFYLKVGVDAAAEESMLCAIRSGIGPAGKSASIGSSFWPYYARMHGPWPIPQGEAVTVPTGYCEFPHEILRPPRSLAERTFSNLHRWSVMDRGGHFAAMEQPEALAREIRAFFRPLRRL